MNTFLVLLCIFCIQTSSQAQNNPAKEKEKLGIIIGNVLESKSGKPLAYASIGLSLLGDSAKPFSTIADKNGAFEFEQLAFGYYRLTVNAIGFAITNLDSIYLRAERYDFNLGDIKLNDSTSA